MYIAIAHAGGTPSFGSKSNQVWHAQDGKREKRRDAETKTMSYGPSRLYPEIYKKPETKEKMLVFIWSLICLQK